MADIDITMEMKLIGNAMKEFRKTTTTIMKNGDQLTRVFKKVGGEWQVQSSRMVKNTKGVQREFAGWAMSIMFFGMALKRVFDTIWKSSTKTFNDVMSSVEGSVTGFQMLDGALKFLGFSAGQALEPIVMFLIPIIDRISQWITENQELFRTIVVGLGVLGTFFSVLGAGKLALDGFAVALGKVGLSMPWLAALTAFAGISWEAFNETPEAWKALKDATSGTVRTAWKSFKETVEGVLEAIFDTKPTIEDLAWILAWLGTIGINAFAGVIKSIEVVIALIGRLIVAYKALFFAMTGQGGKAKTEWEKIKDLSRDIADNISEIGSIGKDQAGLILGGVGTFKENALAKQAAQASVVAQDYGVIGPGFTDLMLGGQSGSIATPMNPTPIEVIVQVDNETIFNQSTTAQQRFS